MSYSLDIADTLRGLRIRYLVIFAASWSLEIGWEYHGSEYRRKHRRVSPIKNRHAASEAMIDPICLPAEVDDNVTRTFTACLMPASTPWR